MITTYFVDSVIANATRLSFAARVDNLVQSLGERLPAPGYFTHLYPADLLAPLAYSEAGAAGWMIQYAIDAGLVVGGRDGQPVTKIDTASGGLFAATLTAKGWQHFETLQRAPSNSRMAFMAMQFGDAALDTVFRDCFQAAAARAGFDLVRVDTTARAGLIDDKLRIDIRGSHFMVSDITHANRGAYWEAGYAEGLGKPVIYTCRKDVMSHEDKDRRPHFDTNHHLIIVWDPEDLKGAEDALTACIRATLPEIANLADPPVAN